MQSFAQRLQSERERLGLTQEQFAEKTAVSRISQGNYERGQRKPDSEYLSKAAEAGVDVEYVITGARNGEKTNVFPEWLDTLPYGDEPDTDVYVEVRRVSLRLSAGISGFAVEYHDDPDISQLWFRRTWLARRGWNPAKLIALDIGGMSMYPGLKPGDTVLVNTASTEMKDGKVFAVNYEGEAVIKRLVRDAGQWWLVSDNPDQATYPRKLCDEHSIIIGQVVHKQSEEI